MLMDDIDQELIRLLSTKIGMLMEDHSARALTGGGKSGDEQKEALVELGQASDKIHALVAAVRSVSE